MKTPRTNFRGFTLVETVLALGVAGVALLSVMGLLGVAVETTGAAGRDTTMVAMRLQVLNDLRSAPFDALWKAEPSSPANASAVVSLDTVLPVDSRYFFTIEGAFVRDQATGALVTDYAGAVAAGAIYECVVKKTRDATTQSITQSPAPPGPYNSMKLQLSFSWPVPAREIASARPGQQTAYAVIARY